MHSDAVVKDLGIAALRFRNYVPINGEHVRFTRALLGLEERSSEIDAVHLGPYLPSSPSMLLWTRKT